MATEKKIVHLMHPDFAAGDPAFIRTMSQLLGPPLVPGNSVTALHNGAAIFPAMLKAIREARQSITFENFVWDEGCVATRFAEALAERARAGVKVHVLQDAMGCRDLHCCSMEKMRNSPIELEIFRFLHFTQFNHRTHRKLLIADGRVGFVGGVGIADAWDGNADRHDRWRDSHYQVEGPVVAQLQQAFMDNWMQTRACVLHGDTYFPELAAAGNDLCQAFKSSAGEGADSARVMLAMSLASARKSIQLANPYFIPDDLIIRTLIDARRRGVRVEIITPGPDIDQRLAREVGRGLWEPLLAAGVRIYEYEASLFHCKYLIVDGCWCSVGSANIDNRSLRLNEETNLNILDEDFAAEHMKTFEADKACSRVITLAEWRRRPLLERVRAGAGMLLRSQL